MVFRETRVHKVQKDRKDLKEFKVLLDQAELDQPGHRVPQGLEVLPGQQDHKDLQGPEVLVVLAHKVLLAHKDLRDREVLVVLAHRDHKVFPARLEPQVQ
jgi:hypothetical protein